MRELVKAIDPRPWLSRTFLAGPAEPDLERREIVRIPASLEIGGRVVDCTIVELTSRAACVHLDALDAAHGAFIGQQGLLRPHFGKPVSTAVRWYTEKSLSLKFMTAVNLGAFSASIDRFREGMQRPGRAQVDLPAQIVAGATAMPCTILNISGGGALVRTPAPFRPGQSVMLQSELLRPMGGYVRWRKDGRLGIMFNRMLPIESAEIVARAFDIHPIWLDEISECHRD